MSHAGHKKVKDTRHLIKIQGFSQSSRSHFWREKFFLWRVCVCRVWGHFSSRVFQTDRTHFGDCTYHQRQIFVLVLFIRSSFLIKTYKNKCQDLTLQSSVRIYYYSWCYCQTYWKLRSREFQLWSVQRGVVFSGLGLWVSLRMICNKHPRILSYFSGRPNQRP